MKVSKTHHVRKKGKGRGKVRKNPRKKKIKEALDWYFLNSTGYRKINGGYAETTIKSISQKNGLIRVKGFVKYGKQDMGDGHSVEYTDTFNLLMSVSKDAVGGYRINKLF